MAESPNKMENPRNKILREAAEGRAKELAPELSAIEGASAVEFEPAPVEPPKAQAPEPPAPAPEPAPEPTPAPIPAPEPAPAATPPADTPQPPPVESPPAPVAGSEYVAVKVYGREMQVLKSEVDAAGGKDAYEIKSAAKQELEEVKRKSAELTSLLSQARAAAPPTPAPGAEPAPSPSSQDAEIAQHIQLLQFGTQDQQVAAAKAIAALNARPTLPIDQIVSIATDRVAQQNAMTQFARDYGDILKDEDVARLAIFKEHQLLAEYNQRGQRVNDWNGVYKTIGEDLRKKFGQSQGLNVAARVQAKENLIEPVEAAGKKNLPPEAKPKTPSDIVREVRKSRGQRVME